MIHSLIWFIVMGLATVTSVIWAIVDHNPFTIISIVFWSAAAQTWLLSYLNERN
jgi:hypothetical protein